jgi:uncharacterized cupredoxin-like copper-binding protein
MTRRLIATLAVAVGCLTTAGGYALEALPAAGAGPGGEVLGPGEVVVELDIEYSRFSLEQVRVRPGTLVRFVVHNRDPIPHELVVGDAEVHRRHATGDHPLHPPVPGEVSVGPNRSASTFFVFDEPGTVTFACHLPGHVAHGMVGEIVVG